VKNHDFTPKTGKTTNKTEIDSRYRLLIMKTNRNFYYTFVFSPHDDHRSLYGPVHFFSFSLELSIQEFDSDQLISNFHFPPPYGKLEAADPIDNVEGYPPPRLKLEPPPNESKFPPPIPIPVNRKL
jgi:hypothetical protein